MAVLWWEGSPQEIVEHGLSVVSLPSKSSGSCALWELQVVLLFVLGSKSQNESDCIKVLRTELSSPVQQQVAMLPELELLKQYYVKP
eukprot:3760274-Amphidinium_carterae.1